MLFLLGTVVLFDAHVVFVVALFVFMALVVVVVVIVVIVDFAVVKVIAVFAVESPLKSCGFVSVHNA